MIAGDVSPVVMFLFYSILLVLTIRTRLHNWKARDWEENGVNGRSVSGFEQNEDLGKLTRLALELCL